MYSDTEILNVKSAGTYRMEIDKTVIKTGSDPLNNIRMIVGFSKIGPFNTPVFVKDTKEFAEKFGGIDRTLEMRGSYFHRSCIAALSAGPIYCLNLLKVDSNDKVGVMDFAVSATDEAQTTDPTENLYKYSGMYNIDTFWTASEESLLYNVGRKTRFVEYDGTDATKSTNNLLTFTNIGKTPVSVIVTKSSDYSTMNFQVTCQEWFGKGNVPEYLNENSLISDFMVDVYVISGNWGGDYSNGNQQPYRRFSSDVKFSKYFNKYNGLIRRKNDGDTTDTLFTQFLNEPDVQLLGKYTGSILPGFIDKNGNNRYIEYLVNKDTAINGVMLAVNEEIFTGDVMIDGNKQGIDLIGHSIYNAVNEEGMERLNFLSYNGTIKKYLVVGGEDATVTKITGETYYDISDGNYDQPFDEPSTGEIKLVDFNAVSATKGTVNVYGYYFADDSGRVVPSGTYVKELMDLANDYKYNKRGFVKIGGKYLPIVDSKVTYLTSLVDYEDGNVVCKDGIGAPGLVSINATLVSAYSGDHNFQVDPIVKVKVTVAYNKACGFTTLSNAEGYCESGVANQFAPYDNGKGTFFVDGGNVYKNAGSLSTSDQMVVGSNTYDVNWITPKNDQKIKTIGSIEIMHTDYYLDYVIGKYYDADGVETTATISNNSTVVLKTGELEKTITVVDTSNWLDQQFKENQFVIPVDNDTYKNVVVGNYVLGINKDRLSRIINITGIVHDGVKYRVVTCQEEIAIETTSTPDGDVYSVELFTQLSEFFRFYNVYTLTGFKLEEKHMPNGMNERQHEILDLLDANNKSTNLYNALIDREIIQFRYLVDSFGFGIEENCKAQYTNLCMNRKSAFAIINAPACKDFQNSEDPSFVDRNNSVSAEFIAKGGDPDKNPTFLFTLPDKVNGASWGAYYYPYLKVYSNYTTILVPPAAYVSNNYIKKYSSGKPWETVAGERRGVITGNGVVGVESTLIRDSRDWLEPMGINAIIYRNGIGCEIYANKTAQQKPQSALSSINCREACIYIQDNVERILENYVFESNTAQTRLEIKTLVDNFLEGVKAKDGVYDFNTVMDTSNNTPDIIDRNIGIIDIYIEPVRAMEILFQRLTILKTGSIASGNFM